MALGRLRVIACLPVQVHGEMLYQVDQPAGDSLRTPDRRRGSPATPQRGGDASRDGADMRQRLAAFRQWLRLLLFQLLTLAVQVRQLRDCCLVMPYGGTRRPSQCEGLTAAMTHVHMSALSDSL